MTLQNEKAHLAAGRHNRRCLSMLAVLAGHRVADEHCAGPGYATAHRADRLRLWRPLPIAIQSDHGELDSGPSVRQCKHRVRWFSGNPEVALGRMSSQ